MMVDDDGNDGCNEHEEKRRRMMILATLSALVVDPLPVLSVNELDNKDGIWNYRKRSYGTDYELDEAINWDVPKSRGLNTERMADGINDSIKETSWLATGMGKPEYFSDNFCFTIQNTYNGNVYETLKVKGYKNYCRLVRSEHRSEEASNFDLICCSVTNANEITTFDTIVSTVSCKEIEGVLENGKG